MKDKLEEYQMIDIAKLVPYEQNTKMHSRIQVQKIASSIENYGFDVPIVCDENFMILKGHGRYEALKKLGREKVPVIVREGLSEAEKKVLSLSDNKLAESPWDPKALVAEILDLEGFADIKDLGFDKRALDKVVPDDMVEELTGFESIVDKQKAKEKHRDENMFDENGERNPFYGESSMIAPLEDESLYKLNMEDFANHHDDVIVGWSSGKDSVHEDSRMWFKIDGKLVYSTPAKLVDELVTIKTRKENKHGQMIMETVEKVETPAPTTFNMRTAKILFKPVKYIMYHEISDPLYKVETIGRSCVTVTKDHSLMCIRGERGNIFGPFAAIHLNMEDRLILPNKIEAEGHEVDLPDWVFRFAGLWIADGCYALNRKIVMSTGNDQKVIDFLSKIPRLPSKEDRIREILPAALLKYGTLKEAAEVVAKDFSVSISCVYNAHYKKTSENTSGGKPKSKYIRLRVLDNGDVWMFNKHLVETMQGWGFVGLCRQKRVPNWLFSASERQIALFLAGYVDGDGCITDRAISVSSVNEELLKDVRDLFLRFGISGGISYQERIGGFRSNYTGLYNLYIGNRQSIARFQRAIPTFKNREKLGTSSHTKGARRTGDVHRRKIKSITMQSSLTPVRVFDFEISDSHMFIADGVIVHNSSASAIWCFEHLPKEKIHLIFSNPGYRVEWPQTIAYIEYANDFFQKKYGWEEGIIVTGSNDVSGLEDMLLQRGFPVPHMCYVQAQLKLDSMKAEEKRRGWRDGTRKVVKIIAIRWGESKNREREYPQRGKMTDAPYNFMSPIIDWSGMDTVKYIQKAGARLNSLYQFSPRAGCMLCPSSTPVDVYWIKKHYPESYRVIMRWHGISARKKNLFSRFVDKFLVLPDEITEDVLKKHRPYKEYAMTDEELVLELERIRGEKLPRPYFT